MQLQRIQRCFSGFYYVTEEDLKFFNRNFLSLSTRRYKIVAFVKSGQKWRSGLQIIKYFSHRHKLHFFEEGLQAIACFKMFRVIRELMLLPLRFHTFLLSSVLILLLNDALWFGKRDLKVFSATQNRIQMPSQIFS